MTVDLGTVLLGVAAISTVLLSWWSQSKKIGKPNGQGNVVQMSERILMEVGGIKQTLEGHTTLLAEHTTQLTKLEASRVEVHTDPSGQHVTVSTPNS